MVLARARMPSNGVVTLAGLIQGWQTDQHDDFHPYRASATRPRSSSTLYHCFSVGLRDVKTIPAARGIAVSYETIRE